MDVPRPPGSEVKDVRPDSQFRGLSDVEKQKEEDWMKKGVLVLILRGCALLFSFLAFILKVSTTPNLQLGIAQSYGLAAAIITVVYTAIQVGIKGDELRTGREVISPAITAVWIDFIGDQVLAYMLLSSASSGATDATILKVQYIFPPADILSASVAMSFLAFFSLAPAALISGYKFFIELSRS